MKKMMAIILVVGLILVTGLLVIERARVKNLEALAAIEKEKLSELEKVNSDIDRELKSLAQVNQALEKRLAEYEKEKAEANEKLKESERRLKEIQGQVEAMTPDALVSETRRILKDSGVERIDAGARFTLAAFQKNTTCLLEWEEFSLVKIPALEEKIQVQEKINLNLQNQVFLLKESDRLWRQKNIVWLEERTILNNLVTNYTKQVKSQKRQKIWTFVLGGLAGFGIYALVK